MENTSKDIFLEGTYCTIVPLSVDHLDPLIDSVKDGELWRLWYAFIPEPKNMEKTILMRLKMKEEGSMIPFTVIDNQSSKPVGMVSYMNIDKTNKRLEIGGIWYRKKNQRTGLNTECIQLLLTHAFESMNCIAVVFQTHALNKRFQQSIERLGAKLDGIMRNHIIMPNGTLRDTYVYSIISSEWLTIKTHLNYLTSNYVKKK